MEHSEAYQSSMALIRVARILALAPERIPNRVDALPHLSIARLKRLTEEEGCVIRRSAARDPNLGVQRDGFAVSIPDSYFTAEDPGRSASEGVRDVEMERTQGRPKSHLI